MRESPPDTGFTARRGNRRDYHRAPAGVDMDVSDRHNWLLSGLVSLLLVANGLARLPRWSAALDLVLAGALVTGGGLASVNAYVMQKPGVLVARVHEKFEDGELIDSETGEFLEEFLDAFDDWVDRRVG